MLRICARCKETKDNSMFGLRGKRPGLKAYCKKCESLVISEAYWVRNKPIPIIDLDGEVWRTLKIFNGSYMISNKGRVKS